MQGQFCCLRAFPHGVGLEGQCCSFQFFCTSAFYFCAFLLYSFSSFPYCWGFFPFLSSSFFLICFFLLFPFFLFFPLFSLSKCVFSVVFFPSFSSPFFSSLFSPFFSPQPLAGAAPQVWALGQMRKDPHLGWAWLGVGGKGCGGGHREGVGCCEEAMVGVWAFLPPSLVLGCPKPQQLSAAGVVGPQQGLWGSPCSCWVRSLAVQTMAIYEDHRQSERPLSAGCGRLTELMGKFFPWEMEKPTCRHGAAELGRAGTGRAALRGGAPQTGNEEPGTGLCPWPVASATGRGWRRGRWATCWSLLVPAT